MSNENNSKDLRNPRLSINYLIDNNPFVKNIFDIFVEKEIEKEKREGLNLKEKNKEESDEKEDDEFEDTVIESIVLEDNEEIEDEINLKSEKIESKNGQKFTEKILEEEKEEKEEKKREDEKEEEKNEENSETNGGEKDGKQKKKFQCPFCPEKFGDFYYHMNKYHEDKKDIYEKILECKNISKNIKKSLKNLEDLQNEIGKKISEINSDFHVFKQYNEDKNYFDKLKK